MKPHSAPAKKTQMSNALTQLMDNAGLNAKPQLTQTWDELEDYYTTIGLAMAQLVKAAGDSTTVMVTLGYGGDQELKTTFDTLVGDCTGVYTERLLALRAQHAGKTGPAADGKELAQILGLASDYQTFYSQYTTTTFSQIMIITEHMDRAQLLYAQAKKAAEATDPSVVTDAEFKEVKPAEPEASTTTQEKTE